MRLPTTKRIPKDDIDEIVETCLYMKEKCAEHGLTVETHNAMMIAVTKQKSVQELHASEIKEARGYMYDSYQRNIDRAIHERRHHENLAASREDKDWVSKLVSMRDKAMNTLSTTIAYSVFGILALSVIVPLMRDYQNWQQMSYQELFCGREQVLEPTKPIDFASSYTDQWTDFINLVWSYFLFATSCACYTATQFFHQGFVLMLITVVPWIVGKWQQVLPEPIKWLATSALWIYVFYYEGWISKLILKQLGFFVVVLGTLAWFCLHYTYKSFRTSFTKSGRTPSSAQLNKIALAFDDAELIIQVTPVCGGIFWWLMNTSRLQLPLLGQTI